MEAFLTTESNLHMLLITTNNAPAAVYNRRAISENLIDHGGAYAAC